MNDSSDIGAPGESISACQPVSYTKRMLKFPLDQRLYHRRVAENAEKSHKNLCELGVSAVKSENSTCAWYKS
jgi:hypothetical protein